MVSYHPAKFGGHRHSDSGDIIILVLQDQSVMLLYGWEPIKVSYHPTKFGSHRHCDRGDIMCLVCLVIFR